jgi:DNA-binding NtrC family response regulator
MERILVIDDEPLILKMLIRYLGAEGYNVLTAKDGKEGLDIFQKQRPPLVITDVRMPGISGLEVLKGVKAIDSNTEVIVVTGHADMEISIEALRLEASDFITKPVGIELLQLSISRAFDKQKIKKQLSEYAKNLEGLLEQKTKEIEDSHAMLLQSEKLASIGQLAAGVAHEINNPIGFISSNLTTH